MATPKNLISIPRPPAGSFNKHRPVSTLLTSQRLVRFSFVVVSVFLSATVSEAAVD